jgi:hypothetical protein
VPSIQLDDLNSNPNVGMVVIYENFGLDYKFEKNYKAAKA